MTLTDKIKEALKEGFDPKGMKMAGESCLLVGVPITLALYIGAGVIDKPEVSQLYLFGGLVATSQTLTGATIYGIGKYFENKSSDER
ncbi:hypothetical protein HYX11_01680 [Candidatus Woesearchaeota archaeon]|nr:hypothetical protein [Candidatus Woesearchaeota archaeon]